MFTDVFKNNSPATVRIDAITPDEIIGNDGGCGSGFIIDHTGIIITNHHVVENSTQIYISIPQFGQNKFSTKIISVFPQVDIALIQIEDISEFKNNMMDG